MSRPPGRSALEQRIAPARRPAPLAARSPSWLEPARARARLPRPLAARRRLRDARPLRRLPPDGADLRAPRRRADGAPGRAPAAPDGAHARRLRGDRSRRSTPGCTRSRSAAGRRARGGRRRAPRRASGRALERRRADRRRAARLRGGRRAAASRSAALNRAGLGPFRARALRRRSCGAPGCAAMGEVRRAASASTRRT